MSLKFVISSFILLSLSLLIHVQTSSSAVDPSYFTRALFLADHIASCEYTTSTGLFPNELLWQSGNTLESLSNALILLSTTKTTIVPKWGTLLENSLSKTPVLVDQCYDDHQWWLLAWLRAYTATSNILYLRRAAAVFDDITTNAWTPLCGGGVLWCPAPTAPYKNAITNELFLAASIGLHPYASVLGRPVDYYLQWAQKEWQWFEASGLINAKGLVNDGLDAKCQNNGGTTWTYNQGVILSGLSELASATSNKTLLALGDKIVNAVIGGLTTGGILVEPCPNNVCDGDQKIFKGVFMRHLGYYISSSSSLLSSLSSSFLPYAVNPNVTKFILNNAMSVLSKDNCKNGGFGLNWQGPCDVAQENTATSSAVLDALLTTTILNNIPTQDNSNQKDTTSSKSSSSAVVWTSLGLGNCEDNAAQVMSNCATGNQMDEATCAAAAVADTQSVAYDFQIRCDGGTFCRVRTRAPSCTNGWAYEKGPATTVTKGNGLSSAICVIKA